MIQFLLNQTLVQVSELDPNLTVLQYLRNHVAKCGTKEGCASGDCGACTVVVAEPAQASGKPRLAYRAINSCITFLPSLHGKQLITVDDLANGNVLHPVQQALVDHHGSQCGFCTPGFVMALFAASKQPLAQTAIPASAGLDEPLQALAGNLCRCTGYRPIVAASRALAEKPLPPDRFDSSAAATLERLQQLNSTPLKQVSAAVSTTHAARQFFAPDSVEQLTALLDRYPQARLLAGGTDLALEVTQRLQPVEVLIYLGRIAALRAVEQQEGALVVGAAVSLTDLYHHLVKRYPDCYELLERFGSPQIRNQATLGGNLGNASPIGDLAPVLIALGARLTLTSSAGSRELAVEDFFLDYKKTACQPGEFIESVQIPAPQPGWVLKAYKVSKRLDDDISAVMGVFYGQIQQGQIVAMRIAFGGMAAVPKRAAHVEQALLGRPLSLATMSTVGQALAQDFSPISDARASAEYRCQVASRLPLRLYHELTAADSRPVRVTRYA